MNQVRVSTRGAKRIRHGHLWVYRSDVNDSGEAKPGDLVQVLDEANNFVGQAFYSDMSQIALRFLSTTHEAIDLGWWRARLRECAERRCSIDRVTNAYRLVYSEGDLLPSLIVDVYDRILVMQNLSQGSERLKQTFTELLIEEFQPRAIIERNDARVREFEGLALQAGIIWTAPADYSDCSPPLAVSRADQEARSQTSGGSLQIEINQNGVRFLVSPLAAQKTGAFLDQRENYLAARAVAFGQALDCFTFHGGFALHLAAKCESVLGLDISSEAIVAARRNAQLNGISNVDFREANVFDALRDFESGAERFDTIILDPPAFAKNRASVAAAARGYKEINLRALKLLRPGGILVSCTCSYHMSEEMFLDLIAQAALDAHRRVQIIEQRGQSSDHPVLLGVPETHYLKCVIARVIV